MRACGRNTQAKSCFACMCVIICVLLNVNNLMDFHHHNGPRGASEAAEFTQQQTRYRKRWLLRNSAKGRIRIQYFRPIFQYQLIKRNLTKKMIVIL